MSCRVHSIVILSLLLQLPLFAIGQRPFNFMNDNRRKLKIPFRLERNLIVVPVYINGHGPFNFILDTGVSILIITKPSLKDSIGLTGDRTIKIRGLGERSEERRGGKEGVRTCRSRGT